MSKPNINNAIVRILKDNGDFCQPVGAGFLVTHRHIFTCAHVIKNAFGISEYTDEPPLSAIFIDFPLLTKHRPLSATVHKLYPIKEKNSIGEFEDICVLELSLKTALPREAYPIPLVALEGNAFFDRSVQMFGFPDDKADGDWLNGRLQGTIKNGWIQIESEGKQWGFAPEFSGTAVWEQRENVVAGMLVNSHDDSMGNTGYMIPVVTLVNAWAELEQQTRPPTPEKIGLETLDFSEIAHDTSIRHRQPLRDWIKEYHRIRFLQNNKYHLVPSWETANQDEEIEQKASKLEASNYLQQRHGEIRGETRALIQARMQKKQISLKRMTKSLVFSLAFSLGFATLAWWSWDKWLQYVKRVEEQKQDACISRKEAIGKKNKAIHTQSLFLADLARQEIEQNHPVEGMLLALEALPKDINQPNQRPYVSEAEVQLNNAVFEQRERLVMPTQSAVFHVGFSPDGNKIVTTGKEGDVRLWNSKEGKLLYVLKGHTKNVYHADFSPDGKLLVTAGWDNTARLWQVATGKLLQIFSGHKESIEYATFSPDGKLLATVSFDNTARLWQVTTGKLLKVLIGHKESIEHAAFSPNGEILATASNDNTAQLWQVSTGKLLKILTGHEDAVFHVAFSPNGKLLVTASNDNTARLWQVSTGKQLKVLSEHQNGIRHAAFSPNGELLITAGWDDTARLWLVKTGQLLKELNQHEDNVRYATFSPDGKLVVTVSDDNTARLWLAETGQLLNLLTGHTDDLNHAAFSSDGKLLVTASDDSTARLWQVSNERLLKKLNQHKDEIWHLAFSPDGKLIVTASNDHTARLWQVETGKELKVLSGHTDEVRYAAFSPDGKLLATASWDKTACLWQVSTGKRLNIFTGHEDKVRHVAFSPDGKLLITASEDNTARLWQVSTGKLHKVLNQHKDSVFHAAFSPDGKLVATASLDNIARLWLVSTGELFKELIGHQSHVLFTDFSPDGETLVTTSWDNTARLWQVSTGQLLKELIGHKDAVFHAAFNFNGKLLVTASWDNTARLWQVPTGQLLKELIGHKSFVMHAAFSPDGKLVATASKDNTARLWEVSTGQLRKTFIGHKSLVTRAVFSPDGKLAATASKDNTARLWRVLSTQELINYANHKVPRCLTPKQRRQFFLPESESEMLIKEGEALARKADIKTALIKFTKAKALTPCFKFDPKAKILTLLIKRGEELAQQGKIQAAVISFSKAIEVDSRLQLHQPENYARKLARLTALVQIENGLTLAEQGDIEKAIAVYKKAQQIDTHLDIPAHYWNHLCWNGSLYGYAAKVIDACEKAVAYNPKNESYHDSRGFARALSGNIQGAIEDFQFYIERIENEARKQKLQGWVNALQNGENPLTKKVLLVEMGLALAEQGEIERAIDIYQEAQQIETGLEISVDNWLRLCVLGNMRGQGSNVKAACAEVTLSKAGRIKNGLALAVQGHIRKAVAIYQEAQRANLEISVDDWLGICALGHIYGQPIKVKKACAKAIPIEDSENINQRLNRSIARVLAGNIQDAIEDIQWLLIKYIEDEKVKILLQSWRKQLLRYENPFSKEDLKELIFE
jgi:WD40 repeat protein